MSYRQAALTWESEQEFYADPEWPDRLLNAQERREDEALAQYEAEEDCGGI